VVVEDPVSEALGVEPVDLVVREGAPPLVGDAHPPIVALRPWLSRLHRRREAPSLSTRPSRVLTRDPTHGGWRMNLKPLDDRIVVKANEAEEKTASGLVIPDTAKEKPQQGTVLAVGPGRRSEHTGEIIPLDVKVGDTVVYSKYGGTEITVDGEDLLILSGRDVLAILANSASDPPMSHIPKFDVHTPAP